MFYHRKEVRKAAAKENMNGKLIGSLTKPQRGQHIAVQANCTLL